MKEDVANFIEDLSQRDFIVFAGTGVTSGTGLPSWKELLKALFKVNPIDVIEVDKVDESQYPEVAQQFYDSLKTQGKEDLYRDTIKKTLRVKTAPFSTPQTQIIKTTGRVVTTNFDDTFEGAFDDYFEDNGGKLYKQFLPTFDLDALRKEYSLTYLHGRIHEDAIVFRSDDYKLYYPSVSKVVDGVDVLEQYLRYMYMKHIIVFIGFSFRDSYVRMSIKNIYERLKLNDEKNSQFYANYVPLLDGIQHYAFCKEDDIQEDLIEWLDSIKIRVVKYKEHNEWIDWFRTIRRKLRKASETGDKNLTDLSDGRMLL